MNFSEETFLSLTTLGTITHNPERRNSRTSNNITNTSFSLDLREFKKYLKLNARNE